MTIKKIWEWTVRENVDEWGDADNIAFFDAKELAQAIQYMRSGDELLLYLRELDRYDDIVDTDYADVDLETMTLPDYMDGGSTIPKYIRKQLKR
tara:strand:- start:165 stop:446 length:282 start_codon:yes stop_codon:yes gene_type:complete